MNAILVVDKPAGITSHDAVARVRKITGEKSVGHLGTLDPLATGVLPMLLGKYTRLAQFFADGDKEYSGTAQFGWSTDTYDSQGQPTSEKRGALQTITRVFGVLNQFKGEIMQQPPAFSAVHVNGKRAHELARRKLPVDLPERKVFVHEWGFLGFDTADYSLSFSVRVGPGTYVRSLIHDIGQAVGIGAHLTSLRRTRSGEFWSCSSLAAIKQFPNDVQIHPRSILPQLPAVTADQDGIAKIRHGNSVNLPEYSDARLVKVFSDRDTLIAIAARIAGSLFHPKVVLL